MLVQRLLDDSLPELGAGVLQDDGVTVDKFLV